MGFRRNGSFGFSLIIFLVAIWLAGPLSSSALGKEKKKDLPARGISVYPEYTGVIVSEGEDVSIDLIVTNQGKRDENIDLTVTSIPKGWKAWIKTYSFAVTGVHVKSDSTKNLTLKAEPDQDVKPGTYAFEILGQTQDRQLASSSQVVVSLTEKKKAKKIRGVNIITSYPVLRGPSDAKFEFSLEVENKLEKDSIFNLSYQGPENWDINFKPAYEEKFISSLRLKANQSQTMAVEVKPSPWEKPGEYRILVKVNSPEAEGEVTLSVMLTGTHNLEAGTASGLLSLDALKGKSANLSIFVKNTGSATLNNIQLLSLKPENWKVEFSPEKIDSLQPQDIKQVEASITPAEQALVGDYSVGLSVDSGKVTKNLELRVTVKASAAWSWIGIGIIVLVMIGLVVLFVRLGRR